MAMQSMSDAFAGAFKSERLIYKNVEDIDAHKDWLWDNLWSNPVIAGLTNPSIFMPASKTTFKADIGHILTKSLIFVLICIPAANKAVGQKEAEAEESDKEDEEKRDGDEKKEKDGEKKKKDEDDTIIGMISLSKSGSPTFALRTGIGISIADAYQNKGYGREAINWAVDWAFTFGNMHRVEIGTASFNDRGKALYESMGFKREGVSREVFFMNRKWHDLIEFSMLVHEWEELRGLNDSKSEVPVRTK